MRTARSRNSGLNFLGILRFSLLRLGTKPRALHSDSSEGPRQSRGPSAVSGGSAHRLAQDRAQALGRRAARVAEVDLVMTTRHRKSPGGDLLVVHPLERRTLLVAGADVQGLQAAPPAELLLRAELQTVGEGMERLEHRLVGEGGVLVSGRPPRGRSAPGPYGAARAGCRRAPRR